VRCRYFSRLYWTLDNWKASRCAAPWLVDHYLVAEGSVFHSAILNCANQCLFTGTPPLNPSAAGSNARPKVMRCCRLSHLLLSLFPARCWLLYWVVNTCCHRTNMVHYHRQIEKALRAKGDVSSPEAELSQSSPDSGVLLICPLLSLTCEMAIEPVTTPTPSPLLPRLPGQVASVSSA